MDCARQHLDNRVGQVGREVLGRLTNSSSEATAGSSTTPPDRSDPVWRCLIGLILQSANVSIHPAIKYYKEHAAESGSGRDGSLGEIAYAELFVRFVVQCYHWPTPRGIEHM